MKRLPILVKVSLLLICFSVMLSANNAGSILDDVLQIPYVEDAPVMDGNIEAEWDMAHIGMRVYTTNNDPALPAGGAADLSAWYAAAWNEDGLYLYAEIFDDSVVVVENPMDDAHVSDSWEIFIDGDNTKGAAYDENSVQYRFIYDYTFEQNDSLDCDIFWAEITGGYAIELSIPAASLADTHITLEAGKLIGWETQVNDLEAVGGARQNQVKWWSPEDAAWQATQYFGTAKLCGDDATNVLRIPRLDEGIVMDGNLDDNLNECHKVTMPVATTNNTPNFADGGQVDLSSWYKVGWNVDGLYFYGECYDDSVVVVEDPMSDAHVSDSWEIFIDGDNTKGAAYDENSVQYRWIYDYTFEQNDSLDCEVLWAELSDGYAIELSIPAASLADTNITLADDTEIGWDVQINDLEVVGGARQNQITWWHHDDRAWQATQYFGSAVLSSEGGISEPTAVAADVSLSVPALVASNNIAVSCAVPAGAIAKVSLLNVAGQVVKAEVVNGSTVNLDVSDLANGVYLCNLKAGNNSVTKKVTLLK